ncbi:hypothetical protein RND81_08G049200 [Saponaria officinalis]|uniref:F-box domain-containing protein n=1 Tax=Saponaria officinalis TaxID=3572 RepID=A0AAW1J3W9_SAPOF
MVATETKWLQMKQCRVGHVQESIKGCNRITCLSHELLIEILLRLPNCKSVVRCQSVCKRWATVASDPWFISQFIDLKLRDGLPFGIVMWYKPNRYSLLWDGSESFFTRSIFDTRDSSFSPFPGLDDVHASATLVASCNDLLLYSRHEKGNKYDLYISNVQTRQWVALPSPPCYSSVLLYGLVCDPLYPCSVVVIPCVGYPSKKWVAHVFSLAIHGGREWCNRVLALPKKCTSLGPMSGVCFDGKLYFHCCDGIVCFDLNNIEFKDKIRCHLVKWPKKMSTGRNVWVFHRGI